MIQQGIACCAAAAAPATARTHNTTRRVYMQNFQSFDILCVLYAKGICLILLPGVLST